MGVKGSVAWAHHHPLHHAVGPHVAAVLEVRPWVSVHHEVKRDRHDERGEEEDHEPQEPGDAHDAGDEGNTLWDGAANGDPAHTDMSLSSSSSL